MRKRLLDHQFLDGHLAAFVKFHKVHALGHVQGDLLREMTSSLPKVAAEHSLALQVGDGHQDWSAACERGFQLELALVRIREQLQAVVHRAADAHETVHIYTEGRRVATAIVDAHECDGVGAISSRGIVMADIAGRARVAIAEVPELRGAGRGVGELHDGAVGGVDRAARSWPEAPPGP